MAKSNPSPIYDRELSWLDFNERVMQEAQDPSVPLIQRLRFLGIYANNMNGFIKVRIASLLNITYQKDEPEKTEQAQKLLEIINRRIEIQNQKFHNAYSELTSRLEENNIFIKQSLDELNPEQLKFCKDFFLHQLDDSLHPVILGKHIDESHIRDSALYMCVAMRSEDEMHYAIFQVPVGKKFSRFVILPAQGDVCEIIFLEDLIRLCIDDIFYMFSYQNIEAHTFQIERDGDITLDDDTDESLESAVTRTIIKRESSRAVRLIVTKGMPEDMCESLSRLFSIEDPSQIEQQSQHIHLSDLVKFPRIRPEFEYPSPTPSFHPAINPSGSIFKAIEKQDILLCYPYHTFNHFIDTLREAAIDPHVKRISISIYRLADDSKVVDLMINAVRNGKKVRALIELKARFDEEHNIEALETLKAAGVKIIDSTVDIKVHCKLLLVEREIAGRNIDYTYVGTGNFNEDTASIYSDMGLLTTDSTIAEDAKKVFKQLKNPHKHLNYQQLMVAPNHMRGVIESLIEQQISNAKKGKEAHFDGKFNAITDVAMIELLYRASRAGVKIRLIVRGECSLVAGISGVSENIEVHSIIDKYLEHARVIITHCEGEQKCYILSADLMKRNLVRRIEVGVRLKDPRLIAKLKGMFEIQWSDTLKSRYIRPPFSNEYVRDDNPTPYRSQEKLHAYFNTIDQD